MSCAAGGGCAISKSMLGKVTAPDHVCRAQCGGVLQGVFGAQHPESGNDMHRICPPRPGRTVEHTFCRISKLESWHSIRSYVRHTAEYPLYRVSRLIEVLFSNWATTAIRRLISRLPLDRLITRPRYVLCVSGTWCASSRSRDVECGAGADRPDQAEPCRQYMVDITPV